MPSPHGVGRIKRSADPTLAGPDRRRRLFASLKLTYMVERTIWSFYHRSMRYRRLYVPGATYFFTVVTADRRSLLCEPAALAALREALRAERDVRPFATEAIVVLPDHLHAIWRLPDGDADISTRWRRIKARITVARGSGTSPVWQSRFWEHLIRDERDLAAHLDYVHFNPVRHGLVAEPAAWPWPSFHRHVKAGMYPTSWTEAPVLTVPHD